MWNKYFYIKKFFFPYFFFFLKEDSTEKDLVGIKLGMHTEPLRTLTDQLYLKSLKTVGLISLDIIVIEEGEEIILEAWEEEEAKVDSIITQEEVAWVEEAMGEVEEETRDSDAEEPEEDGLDIDLLEESRKRG